MLEKIITPEFLAKQEGISVEEAKSALAMTSDLTKDVENTLNDGLQDTMTSNTDNQTTDQIVDFTNNFIKNLTGKTPSELAQEANKK